MPQNNQYPGYSHDAAKRIVWGVSLGVFLSALDQTIVAPVLGVIGNSLSGSGEVSWVISAYLFAVTIFTPFAGKLSDLYGRRRVLMASILFFSVASLLCAFAQTLPQLIFFRVLQGIGGAGLMTMAHAAIADVVPPRQRGRYQVYLSSMWALGSVGGPILGSLLAAHASWRLIFLVNVPLGVITLFVCAAALKRAPQRQRQSIGIDYPGAVLVALLVANAITMLSWDGGLLSWSWSGMITVSLTQMVLLVALIFVENRTREPFFPLTVISKRDTASAMALSLINAFLTFAVMLIFPILFGAILPGNKASAFLLTPFLCSIAFFTFIGGTLARRLGRLKEIMVGASVLIFSGCLSVWLLALDNFLLERMLAVICIGCGIGLIQPAITLAVQSTAEKRHLGVASSTMLLFRSIGGAFGASVCGALLFVRPSDAGQSVLGSFTQLVPGGLSTAQLTCAVVAAIGLCLSLTMRQVRLQE